MARKPRPGAWRIFYASPTPGLRLITPEGWQLLPGEDLDLAAAREAAKRHRVVWHAYGSSPEEITGDPARLRDELAKVDPCSGLFCNSARVFSDGEHRILVIEWHH